MEQGIDNARFGAFVARLRKEKGLTQRSSPELVGSAIRLSANGNEV